MLYFRKCLTPLASKDWNINIFDSSKMMFIKKYKLINNINTSFYSNRNFAGYLSNKYYFIFVLHNLYTSSLNVISICNKVVYS